MVRWLKIGAGVLLFVGAAYVTYQVGMKGIPQAQIAECRARYDSARTIGDTSVVDSRLLPSAGPQRWKTCGELRTSHKL